MKHLNIKIFGLVQGVSFRFFAREKACQLSLAGFVQNQEDGSIYIEAEGDDENLEKFIKYLHKGPIHSRVDKVEVEEGELKKYQEFKILVTDS